jgi:hypothetical protein
MQERAADKLGAILAGDGKPAGKPRKGKAAGG